MPRCPRLVLGALLLLVLADTARADCPTRIEELPAAGFLAATTREALEPDAAPPPALGAELGAAGGFQADRDAVVGTGELAAQLTAHRKGLAGCASGSLLAARTTAARATASVELPLLLSGITLGVALDHDVVLPFSARPQYLRAPASQVATQIGIAFLDLALRDGEHRLRVVVVPARVETALASQHDASGALRERLATRVEASMFRFDASDATSTGSLGLFGIATEWTRAPDEELDRAVGFMRFAPLTITSERPSSRVVLDGGVLSLSGPEACTRCSRGFYRLALGHRWRRLWLEARAERTAFVAADGTVALEDRATSGATLTARSRRATATAFAARTRAFEGGPAEGTGGVRLTLSQQLRHGFTAVVDGELARGYYGTADAMEEASEPRIERAARVLVSLGWKRMTSR